MNGAVISDCEKFRYRLWRVWKEEWPRVLWIMLNPSTADASIDDATIRKCIAFAKFWGMGGIEVCNLYAYRTKDPLELPSEDLAIGPDNDKTLRAMLANRLSDDKVVTAWGAHASDQRVKWFKYEAAHEGVPLYYLRLNKDGNPGHPLYIPMKTELQEWLW